MNQIVLAMASTYSSESLSTGSFKRSPEATPALENKKFGRPNQWTDSRQRKLARLYLFTNLPPNDIRQALSDKTANWLPEKETTTKTYNALFDKDPRWLRPKTREEMEERIMQLATSKTRRRLKRQVRQEGAEIEFDGILEELLVDIDLGLGYGLIPAQDITTSENIRDAIPDIQRFSRAEFTRTPVQDLLALDLPSSSMSTLTHLVDLPDGTLNTNIMYSTSAQYSESVIDHEGPAHTRMNSQGAISLSSLKHRLLGYSSQYLDGVTKLLKAYSISGSSSASSTDLMGRFSFDPAIITTFWSPESKTSPSHHTQVALPRAFMVADHYRKSQGPCFPVIKNHDSGICWCMNALELLPKSKRRYVEEALKLRLILDPPRNLQNLTLGFEDAFGNTILHFLAARGAEKSVIIEALERGADGTAKNTAGQTFLHCFCPQFLVELAENGEPALMIFLQKLLDFSIDFYQCDPFGRSFFHQVTQEAKDVMPHSLAVFRYLQIRLPLSRDAFVWVPTLDSITQTRPRPGPYRSYDAWFGGSPGSVRGQEGPIEINLGSHVPVEMEKIDSHNSLGYNRAADAADSIFTKHARLVETAAIALDVPSTEDFQGRNGLQCLAEASLDLHKASNIFHEGANGRGSKKRKRHQNESISSDTCTEGLRYRFELLRRMVGLGVDVNNYDESGSTVLMSLIVHLYDGDDGNILSDIFRYVIKHGADVNRRNQLGETALHIAVRLGRKVATRVLLVEGANIHARTLQGKGVLALGERHYFYARDDPKLYASIMACMALCTHHGAIANPTLVDEWSWRSGQYPNRPLKV